ncbi:MAG: hypothetical protein ACKO1U_03385 [Bacteroidota bacterium]
MSSKRLKRILLFFILFVMAQSSFAQDKIAFSWVDTLHSSLQQKPKFFFNITSFKAFVGDEFPNFFGFRMGLNYKRKIKFGMGFYSLQANKVVSSINVMEAGNQRQTNGFLDARFFSITAEYIYYNRFPWQFSVFPMELGIGGAHYRYNSVLGDGRQLETPDVALIFYQPAFTAQYSILKWLGVSTAAGYRATLYSSKEVREDFNSFTFSAGIRLFLDEAYRAVFPNGIAWFKHHPVETTATSPAE